MTLQIDEDGPSDIAYTSPSFVATIADAPAHVYSFARTGTFNTNAWSATDTVRACCLKWGSDESAQVRIVRLAGDITSYDITPRNITTLATIVDGDLVLTVPTNKRLRVILNGDTANPLHLLSEPLKEDVGATTAWATLALDVDSIDYVGNEITFTAEHGLSTNDRIVFQQDVGAPSTEITGLGLTLYEPYLVDVVSTTRITLRALGTSEGDPAIDLVDGGTSLLISAHLTRYADAAAALHFPAGVHVLGRAFDLADECTIYADVGAWLIGGVDLRNKANASVAGPGHISGQHATYEGILDMQWVDRAEYAPICGFDDANGYHPNRVQGITIWASPFWAICGGAWSVRNVSILSGWTPNTDGIEVAPKSSVDRRSEVVDCFSWSGDDNVRIFAWGSLTVSGCVIVNSAGACLHGIYHAVAANEGWTYAISDCDLINLIDPASVAAELGSGYGTNGFYVRSWLDGWASDPTYGHFNVTLDNIRVWGAVPCRLWSLENKAYPWGANEPGSPDLSRDQYGQIATWTFSNWTVEEAPQEISRIIGRDAVNTPHDLTFTNVVIAGTALTSANESTYISRAYAYNLTFDSVVIEPEGETVLVVEDGTGLALADSYQTLDEADARAAQRGSPAVWTDATDEEKRNWLRQAAASGIDIIFEGAWTGYRTNNDQGLAWPRRGARDRRSRQLLTETSIPQWIKWAQFEFALSLALGIDPLENVDPRTSTDRSRFATSTTDSLPGGLSESRTYADGAPSAPVLTRMIGFAMPFVEDPDRVGLA